MLRSCGYGIIVIVLLLLLSIRTILGTIRERKDDFISLVTHSVLLLSLTSGLVEILE